VGAIWYWCVTEAVLVNVLPAAGTPVVGAAVLNPTSYHDVCVLFVPESIDALVARPIGPGAVRSTTTSWLKLPGVSGTALKSARASRENNSIPLTQMSPANIILLILNLPTAIFHLPTAMRLRFIRGLVWFRRFALALRSSHLRQQPVRKLRAPSPFY
jgi:hypothetical protein